MTITLRAQRLRLLAPLLSLLMPLSASAFCGFYVGGGGAKLFNNATQTVLMRGGTKTVLSMQNNYQGPPENFAMVVPVPVVLQQENVKTLDPVIFDIVDKLAAPRLVEYWEQDPCYDPPRDWDFGRKKMYMSMPPEMSVNEEGHDYGVKIEAQFIVGEYEIVVLSAENSVGLDQWLRDNKYNIPEGAEPVLKPYVQSGMKFFVAKVDIKKVKESQDGHIILSPLRFAYDSETFSLPVRLGLLNSAGTQDLIVHIIAADRYEAANYKNVFIPTNIDVVDGTDKEFGSFYASLFDETLKQNPGSVVTEYSWQATSCDPCAVSPLDDSQLNLLGGDLLPPGELTYHAMGGVLTRLHVRYGKEALGEDLIFKKATAVEGGREIESGRGLEKGANPASYNNFQARYAIRHPWTGPIKCLTPKRGIWGGPPSGVAGNSSPKPAQNLAFAKRGLNLGSYIAEDIKELKIKPQAKQDAPHKGKVRARMCTVDPTDGGQFTLVLLGGFVAFLLASRKRLL